MSAGRPPRADARTLSGGADAHRRPFACCRRLADVVVVRAAGQWRPPPIAPAARASGRGEFERCLETPGMPRDRGEEVGAIDRERLDVAAGDHRRRSRHPMEEGDLAHAADGLHVVQVSSPARHLDGPVDDHVEAVADITLADQGRLRLEGEPLSTRGELLDDGERQGLEQRERPEELNVGRPAVERPSIAEQRRPEQRRRRDQGAITPPSPRAAWDTPSNRASPCGRDCAGSVRCRRLYPATSNVAAATPETASIAAATGADAVGRCPAAANRGEWVWESGRAPREDASQERGARTFTGR